MAILVVGTSAVNEDHSIKLLSSNVRLSFVLCLTMMDKSLLIYSLICEHSERYFSSSEIDKLCTSSLSKFAIWNGFEELSEVLQEVWEEVQTTYLEKRLRSLPVG